MALRKLFVKILTCLSLIIVEIYAHPDAYFSNPLNLYISDQNYSATFNKVVAKENNMIGILFTNKFCKDCYASEPKLI
jgi:thiol-disulfide isomerase/thioredoxin